MPTLTDAWSIVYGGFAFPLYSKSSIAGRPVYDAARRAVQHIQYTLTVESTITANPGSNVEAQLVQIRQQLQTRGSALEIQSTGFGHVRVNSLAGLNVKGVDFLDVAYGPHPEILQARPLGSRLAWHIEWRCTFNIPECSEGTAVFLGRPMEFVYTWDVVQERHGFSTRTISGHLTIPATTVTGQKIPPDQADKYWNAIVASIPPLPSFTRESNRSLSEDRRTLKFTITDTELPANAFVAGATEWSGIQELSTNQQSGFRTWMAGLSATYQVTRGESKVALYKQFLTLLGSRIRAAKPAGAGNVLPLDFRITDQLHSQEVSFSFRWSYVSDVAVAVAASGLWEPLPGNGWPDWAKSVARTALNARGNANLAYSAASDTILDLCDANTSRVLGALGLPAQRSLKAGDPKALQATLPDPDGSWLHYESHIVYDADQGVQLLRTLPTQLRELKARFLQDVVEFDDDDTPFKAGLPRGGRLIRKQKGGVANILPPPPEGASDNLIQQRANPAPRLFLRGRAIRAGYPIAPPLLLAAAGVPAVLKRPRFAQGTIGAAGGIPLLAALWDYEYLLPGLKDDGLPIPPNPLLGF